MTGITADRLEPTHVAPAPDSVVAPVAAFPAVSWGAILVGGLVAIAFGVMLNVLGVALGAAMVDTTARATPGAGTLTLGAGLWLAVSGAAGLLVGGMVASRLAGSWKQDDALLHGFGVWALTFLVAIVLVGGAVSGATLTALRGASGLAAGAAATAVAGGAAAASQVDPRAVAQALQRRLAAPEDPATMPREAQMAELGDLTAKRLADGSWAPADRTRAEALLAQVAGIAPEQAKTRIDQAETEIRTKAAQAEEAARRAADAAAKAAAVAALWAFATMMFGLAAAAFGAWVGARDERVVVATAYPLNRVA